MLKREVREVIVIVSFCSSSFCHLSGRNHVSIISADDFFILRSNPDQNHSGQDQVKYRYEGDKLQQAHQWAQKR